MRGSKVREMVLKQACQIQQPFTIDQLKVACAELNVSRSTVYNAVNLFYSAGMLQKNQEELGQVEAEYELITTTRPHMQFVCRMCGRKKNFYDKSIALLVHDRKYANFTAQRFLLIVYGECKVCRIKKLNNTAN